jgi:hypothetical protein
MIEDHRAFDHISKLADIAGPVVFLKRGHRLIRDLVDPLTHRIAEFLHEGP